MGELSGARQQTCLPVDRELSTGVGPTPRSLVATPNPTMHGRLRTGHGAAQVTVKWTPFFGPPPDLHREPTST